MKSIYLIERSSGEYDDYRVSPVFFTTSLKKAKDFVKFATLDKDYAHSKYQSIMNKLWELPNDTAMDNWHAIHNECLKKIKKLKSKTDKALTVDSDISTVRYTYQLVKELK